MKTKNTRKFGANADERESLFPPRFDPENIQPDNSVKHVIGAENVGQV